MTTAIVLAGGKSTRLGRDKAGEVLLGKTLLQRSLDRLTGVVDEYVVVKAPGQVLPAVEAALPLRVAEDAYPETGPLGGLYTGLAALEAGTYAVAVACDMPLLQPALLQKLLRRAAGHAGAVPLNGLPEPLCAVYATSCLPALRSKLEAGAYKLTGFFEDVDLVYLTPEEWRRFDAEGLSFLNVNRESDLQRAAALISEAGEHPGPR